MRLNEPIRQLLGTLLMKKNTYTIYNITNSPVSCRFVTFTYAMIIHNRKQLIPKGWLTIANHLGGGSIRESILARYVL